MRHFGDPAYMPEGLYAWNLGHPNQLFHMVAWLLSYAVPTSWAVRIVVAVTQVLIFVGGARLAKHLGRSPWGALLLAPLALGFTYYWGLVANLVGYAAFLLALPKIDISTKQATLRSAAAICVILVVLFFAHEAIFMVATGVIVLFALCHPLSWKKTTLRLLPAAFATALAVGHQIYALRFFTKGQINAMTMFLPFASKLRSFPNVLFGSHDLPAQIILLGLSLATMTALVVVRLQAWRAGRTARAEGSSMPPVAPTLSTFMRVQGVLHRHRFAAVGVCLLACYFVFPYNWRGATLIHERFLGPAWAIFAIISAPSSSPPRIARLLAAVVPVGMMLLSWPQFVDADQTYRHLDNIIAHVPKGRAVALVVLDRVLYRTRVYSASAGPARVVATRGGRAGLSLTISPISPVQIRPEYRWDEYDVRTFLGGSRAMKPTHDLNRFEWVIAQSRDPAVRHLLVEAFKPDASFVAESGEWVLFHSNHKIVPLLSPDDPAPKEMETIFERVAYLAQRELNAEKAREITAPEDSK
ncbi:MAG: hypothetical protein FWD69_14415 [Polyangiaceae bacterium]|nr:hypothetical protein [Polyangiaceae bacterium]